MPLARFQFTVVDDHGNVLPGASVEVRRETSGQPIAAIFSDRAGATPLGNPFSADSEGFAAFHAAGGAYQIVATSGAFSRTWRYVGVGLAGEQDAVLGGVPWVFDSTTTDADPGAGFMRMDNATPASVTTLYLSDTSAISAASGFLNSFDDGGDTDDRGIVVLQSVSGAVIIATVTGSVVDGSGYRKLSVTPLNVSGTFVEGELVFLQFMRAGIDSGVSPFGFRSISSIAGGDTIVGTDNGKLLRIGAGTGTLAVTSAATLGNKFSCIVRNAGTGVATIDPSGSETIGGDSTKALQPGQACQIFSDGSNLHAVDLQPAEQSGYMRFGKIQIAWGAYSSSASGSPPTPPTNTFAAPFVDANYRIACVPVDGSNNTLPRIVKVISKAAGSFTAQTYAQLDTVSYSGVGGDYVAVGNWR